MSRKVTILVETFMMAAAFLGISLCTWEESIDSRLGGVLLVAMVLVQSNTTHRWKSLK